MAKKKTVKAATPVAAGEETNSVPHIVAILDISGSMNMIRDDAIGAYNSFIDEQKALGDDAKLTVILFDDQYKVLQDGAPIKDAIKFDHNNFVPRGMTAMNDAIGRTINKFRTMYENGELAAGAIFTVVTDGQENSSIEYTANDIKEMITKAESELDWKFVYLAANQDAFATGKNYGFAAVNTVQYSADAVGVKTMSSTMSNYVTDYRTSRPQFSQATTASDSGKTKA